MILIFPSFLMIIDDMGIVRPKTLNQCLLVASILSTSHLCIKFMQNLETITKIDLHSSSTGLIVKHIKNLTKIHRSTIRSTVSN
ncbi:AC5 [Cowpea bright yellow mosaic virus]|uniref:AC5 n=1 Tax=Cowpea bright yellow mosaic virus TaxID=2174956 RepID=A0A411H9T4_9GEMI|nr:AC5 [Cowpea bright yellow mosaic virus]QBB20373.1 AC5 [Cowpea bright yellow mosaic virus]